MLVKGGMFTQPDRNAQGLVVILRRNYSAKATLFCPGSTGRSSAPANLRPQKRFSSTGIFLHLPLFKISLMDPCSDLDPDSMDYWYVYSKRYGPVKG